MKQPELPVDEISRLASLRELRLLDSPPDERFDTLTTIASRVFDVPIAVVTFVDESRQWFKSCLGLEVTETPRDVSFCGHAILGDGIFLVEDAAADERFHDNPLVTGPPFIRFYAGVPLSDIGGHRLGAFAIVDRRPRQLSPGDRSLLLELARLVELELDRIRTGLQRMHDTERLRRNEARLLEQEARLREADQQKDRFLATLAHELRNPLAPIRNSVQLAKMRHPADAVVERAIAVIDRQSMHLTRILDDLLEIARITQGKLFLHRRPCRVDQLTTDALEGVGPAAEAAGHRLRFSVPPEPLWVHADPTRIVQALQNLLHNAIKYTDPGGAIELQVRPCADRIEIAVKDNGIGIAPEQFENLFEPFAQDHRTLMRRSGGLGIGLALSRRLVEMHGGSITATSPGPHRGAQFVVALPPGQPPADEPSRSPADAATVPRKILVVDDNLDLLESTQTLLELMGHSVTAAATGRQAISAVLSSLPDLVLLDIGLPDMDGNDVATELKRRLGGGCPVLVAVTGWGQEMDRRRTAASGFSSHLTKPVSEDRLREVIAALP